MQQEIHDHDHGLAQDLALMQRRRALGWLTGAVAASGLALIGCGGGGGGVGGVGDDTSTASSSSSSGGSSGGSTSSCPVIPEETAGPYPGDGSNSNGSGIANALALTGIVLSDIRTRIAGASGTAGGIVLTMRPVSSRR